MEKISRQSSPIKPGRQAPAGRRRAKRQLHDAEERFASLLEEPADASQIARREDGRRPLDGRTHKSTGNPADASQIARREDGKKPVDDRTDKPSDDPAGPRLLHGEQILAHMMGTPAPTQAGQDSPPAVHRINEIVRQIADRVLVSSPASETSPEVRIQLKDSLMQGSDVRIFRDGGELKIVFVAHSQDAQNYIAQNKGQIEQALGNRLPDETVNVSIETQADARSSDGQNDGRSRQQYIAEDDLTSVLHDSNS